MTALQAKLIVLAGPEACGPFYIGLDEVSVTLGRSEDNAICLPGPGVSHAHCRLFRRDDRWYVEDLGSENGTKLNGTATAGTQEIQDVDMLQVGEYRLQFLLESVEPVARPKPPKQHKRRSVRQMQSLSPASPTPPPERISPLSPARMQPAWANRPPQGLPAAPQAVKASAPSPSPTVTGATQPAVPTCTCGRPMSPSPGGYRCYACGRWDDAQGGKLAGTNRPRAGTLVRIVGFFRSTRGLALAMIVVVLAAGAGIWAIVSGLARSPDGPEGIVTQGGELLPDGASRLLDIVVKGAIQKAIVSGGEAKPPEVNLSSGQTMVIRLEDKSCTFHTVGTWRGKILWNGPLPEVPEDVVGLSLIAAEEFSFVSRDFKAGTVLTRQADGWHVVLSKKKLPGDQHAQRT